MRRITPMYKDGSVSPALRELMDSLQQTQWNLDRAHAAFNDALDPELVEAAIYEIRSHQSRMNYLLRQIKETEQTEAAALAAMSGGKRRWI